jgi:hypothetical protein
MIMAEKTLEPATKKPYAPENRFLSKEEYVARQRAKKEHDAKVKAYSEEISKEKEAPEAEEAKKKTKK